MRTSMAVGASIWLVAAASGCGAILHPCNESTCTGCCADGLCHAGTQPSACGVSGAACQVCSGATSECGSAGTCQARGTGSSGTGGSGGGLGSGGGVGTGGSSSSGPSCSVSTDCAYWYCDCASGPPVNTRHCTNGRCEDGATACPSSCASFGTCWLGTSSGGFVGGSNAGPSTCGSSGTGGGSGSTCTFSDLGKGCSASSGCQSGLCYGVSPSFICTKACVTANDCPRNWVCSTVSSGGKVCLSGLTSGTPSTASTCTPYQYNDTGGPCTTACASGYCVSSMCSHRCDVNSDCPSPWTCQTGGSTFKSCRP